MLHDLLFSCHVRAEGSPALATPQQMAQIQDEPAYFRNRRKNQAPKPVAAVKLQRYFIDYRVVDPMLKKLANQPGKPSMLEFAAAAYDVDGRMVNGVLNDAIPCAPNQRGDKQAPFFSVEQGIDLPLEAAWLRIAVRDTRTDRTGTLEIPLPLGPEPVAQASR